MAYGSLFFKSDRLLVLLQYHLEGALVVINDFHVFGAIVGPFKADTPLLVNAYAELSATIPG